MSRKTQQALLFIFTVSVVVRIVDAFYLGNNLVEMRGGTYDQISYNALAQRVMQGHGFSFAENHWPYAFANQPTAFWSYLYTLYLAGVYLVFGYQPLIARLIQAVTVGILTPYLTYHITKRTFDKKSALIAAALSACYFYFIHYGASLMSEAFYIVSVLWMIDSGMRLANSENYTSSKKQQAFLSIEFGLAVSIALLLRQVAVVMLIPLLIWILYIAGRQGMFKKLLSQLTIAALITTGLLFPFIARNYRVFNVLSMPNTNAGFAFFWSNHPIYGTQFEATLSPSHGISYQDLIPVELRNLNEAQLDKALLQRGLQFVFDDPVRYLKLSLSRIPIFFIFWPSKDSSLMSNLARVLSFGLYLPFMLLGLFISLRAIIQNQYSHHTKFANPRDLKHENGPHVVLLICLLLAYTVVHIMSWTNVRYRLPVDALLIIFAGYALSSLIQALSVRSSALAAQKLN
ncbi:MAG: glycosyltransferase family 39 protein [Anaerolineae bacterium]